MISCKTSLLGDNITLISGQHVDVSDISEGIEGTAYLTGPTDFKFGRPNSTRKAVRAGAYCEEGDILVVVKGSGTGAAFKSDNRYAIGRQLMAVRANNWHKGFIYYILLFNSTNYREQATGLIPGISREILLHTRLPSFDNKEQQKIAQILCTWDEALEKVDALIEAKERRKKALMQQLLTGKKRVKGFSEPWIRTRMSTFLTRVFRPIEWHPDLPLSLVSLRRRFGGLFRRPDVLGSEYKTRDLHELKKDDFLISKRQVVHGAWAFVTSEFEATHVSKEYVILISSAPDRLYMPFFGWFAQTPRMLRLARVSSTGVHIEKLIFDADVFLKEAIRIPQNIDEQRAISEILNNADREIRLLRTERGALDQQKRGLMQRLLTGKVRVKV
jgi:restriction endonuclease S subunit